MGWKFTLSFFTVCTLFSWHLNGQTDCGTSFFDLGGANGNYADNELAEWTFCPDEVGDLVTLTFTSVQVESCCDDLSIYSGTGTASPLELDLEAPETFTSSSPDGCITVTWDSDGSVTFAGWEAIISCAPAPPCPNPTMLSLVNATSIGAIIQWAQVGDVAVWDMEILPAGTPPTGVPNITDITESPYTWDQGISGTQYDIYLRGRCEEEDMFTNWVGPLTFTTNPACGDLFYDTGGPDNPYQINEELEWVFCPNNPGDQVTLAFLFVEIDQFGDQLGVYNGTGSGTAWDADIESPDTFTSNAEDGCLTVTWDSDGFNPLAGWEALITCNPAPPCPNPIALSATNITSSGATFNWTEFGDSESWNIEIVPEGTMPTGTPTFPNVTSTSFVWDGGESGTSYQFYIQSNCLEGDETSNWTGPEDFTTVPGCGDSFFDPGGPDGEYANSTFLSYTFCPDEAGDQVTINFIYVDVEACCDEIAIYNGSNTDVLLLFDLETPASFTSSAADGCLTVTFDPDGSVVGDGWEALVSCAPAPPCPNTTNLTTTTVTDNGATLSWTEAGEATSWNIEIVPTGTMPTGTPTVSNVTSNPFVWEDGESGTSYDFYVQANCPGGEETSYWAGPASFTTVPGCGDFFFDPGGPNGTYENNTFESYTFCPDNVGDVVVIDFTFVDVEACCDEIAIYDGSDTSIPLELDLEAPATFTSTTSDGCLTVTFDSDGSVIREGWEAFVLCTPCPPIFPQNVSTVNIGAVQAGVLINTNAMGGGLIVEVDTTGFTQGTGVFFNEDGTLLTMTGLTENTTYDYYVTYVCPDGQEGPVLGPFSFTTLFANDLGVTGLVSPNSDCGLTGSEAISIAITNFGANPQTLFPINFAVNGVMSGISQPQDGFYTGIVSRDSTEIFEFDLQQDFSEPGEYTIEVWTEMMEDSNTSNDTFSFVIYNVEPPIYEDFEAGIVPPYFETSPNSYVAPMGDHEAPSSVLSASFDFDSVEPLWLDFPGLGPIAIDDTLFFDYRYVNFFSPTLAAALSPTDSLKVMVSTDCGETYEVISAITGITHEPTTEMTPRAVSLENYEGLYVKIRIEGSYGNGSGLYFLDLDNINLYRCTQLGLTADITGAMPGMDNGQVILTPSGGVAPYEYLWEDGSNEAIRNDLALGNYTVSVTDRFGCTGEITLTVDMFVNNEELPEVVGSINLAPNPTSDQSIVRANFTTNVDARIEVVNMLGQIVWRGPILQNVNQLEQSVDLSNQANGIYLVRIHANDQIVSRKLLKAN